MAHAIPKLCLVVAEGRERKRKEKERKGGSFVLLSCVCLEIKRKREYIISFVWFVKRKEIYVGKFHIVLLLPFYIPIK